MIEYIVRVYGDGVKQWFLYGNLHREDGPAVEYADGSKYWYRNSKLHREDGPAIERDDRIKEWWLDGKNLTEDEWKKRTSKVKEMTVEEISKALGYEVKVVKG
jgi:hypothetical protein